MLSRRAYTVETHASSWEEIWEAGPYYDRISEVLEDARHYAVIVGWQIDSRLPMKRPARPDRPAEQETLKQKVIRLCESKPDFHVYFLMWDHAYFYVLERETWQGRIWDDVHPRVHFVFDNRHPFGGSHHEKICVVDGKIGFCGGIDLCDERWDSRQHLLHDPRRALRWGHEHHGPYHDLAVQVTGPVVAQLQSHVAGRWRALTTIPFPDTPAENPAVHGGHRVYLSRTLASVDVGFRGVPIVREIEFLFRELIREAERRIVLEGQYYWSRDVNDMLIAKAHQMKGKDFEIVVILANLDQLKSLTRHMEVHQLKLLEALKLAAAQSGTKLTIGSPYVHAAGGNSRPVYIHSKVLVVDDRFITVGSANFASRALRLDTEVNLTFEARSEAERSHVEHFADGLLAHWAHEDVRLRHCNPTEDLREVARDGFRWLIETRVPWWKFFDPTVPWFYPLAWRLRKLARTSGQLVGLGVLALWLLGAFLAAGLGFLIHPAHLSSSTAIAFSIVLSSVWLLPIPFGLAVIVGIFRLGANTAAAVALASFWVAAIWGYTLTRLFPTPSARYYRKTGPRWLPANLGLRNFPRLVAVLADPRVSLRSKIVYQGLYSIPPPWFVLGTLVLLPAALELSVVWLGRALLGICGPAVKIWLYAAAPYLLILILGGAILRVAVSKPWKTGV